MLDLRGNPALRQLQRAIGVIYRPQTERHSHYLRTSLARQFDGFIHLDRTRALQPLDAGADPLGGEAAETYPSGL
ncbi:erythromycin esterase family protein [Xylophilus rhododendri]|uniref:erythromycin esterase family protein n=1 Tax=Xylophilus rhododendri TaxID=2697032 RepID=UPI001E575223|nr:erythromycin esterase family protein [Xylophilus rhododendri]